MIPYGKKTTAGASRPRGFDPAMRRLWYSKLKLSRFGPS
jgi:energy-coupling factor transporter transmembrane protein EcfT